MRITRLEVSNFKRIRLVDIRPDGSVVLIRGRNGQGKSSCLDSIPALLGGEKLCPKEPIRRGETEAVIRASLDDFPEFGPIVAERHFRRREDGTVTSTLKLSTPGENGIRLDKPQRRLDELVGKLSFDPLAFMRLPAKEQAETLRKLSGVDFRLLDAKRANLYEERTLANRSVAQVKARVATMPAAADAPDAPDSAADLMRQQNERRVVHDANEAKRREYATTRARWPEVQKRIEKDRADIARLEADLAKVRALLASDEKDLVAVEEKGAALKAEVAALVDPDMEELLDKVRGIEAVNERVRQKKAHAEEVARLATAEAEAKRLDDAIAAIDAQKEETLRSAKLPVPGLSFSDEGPTYEEFPLDQASQSAQLRISVAIGAALNPTLRAMLSREGSFADEDTLAVLADEAAKLDLQLWLEVVGKHGEGIVIEDGQVEGAPVPEAARG